MRRRQSRKLNGRFGSAPARACRPTASCATPPGGSSATGAKLKPSFGQSTIGLWPIPGATKRRPVAAPAISPPVLRSQHLGGKCVDINSLLVGLCRAAGIPARDVYGIRLANSTLYKSLGRSGAITGAQHCRAEVYLEQEGWFAVDPADVRKAILEDNLPPDSPAAAKLADRLFGAWESNWAGYNSATGIALKDAPHKPTFDFMMYPCAMSAKSSANCLDAAHFAYQINSAEITT